MTHFFIFVGLPYQPSDNRTSVTAFSHTEKEFPDFLLEDDENRKSTYCDEFIEQSAHHLHLQHTADKEPYHNECEGADEHIKGSRLSHEAIDVVKNHCYEQYVNCILYAESEKHLLLL
jgi:hypothetical protein